MLVVQTEERSAERGDDGGGDGCDDVVDVEEEERAE